MKFIYVLIVSLLVVGCINDLFHPATKEGEFKTDQEMSDFFVDNYHHFNEASELIDECQGDNQGEIDNESLKSLLELIFIKCSLWPWPDELRLGIYSEYYETYYVKGYFYSEDPRYRESVWEGSLNEIPNVHTHHCYNRHIRANEDEFYNNWYIFALATTCDD